MKWELIDADIQERSLLKHPFYQAWSMGQLTKDDLRFYAGQYYALENHFPRLLSRVHSSCPDAAVRREILENLVDEERGPESHRELWLRFAEGLGLSREEVVNSPRHERTEACVASLSELAADPDPAVGLTALYAYESQLPQISVTKIDGLQRFYGFSEPRALRFFEVHKEADAWHSAAERKLVEASGISLEKARAAARRACDALWGFLDGIDESTRLKRPHACAC